MIDNQAIFEQMLAARGNGPSQQQILAEMMRQRHEMQQMMQQQAAAAEASRAKAEQIKAAQAQFTQSLMSQLQTMYNSNAAQMEQLGYSQLMAGGSMQPQQHPNMARFGGCVGYQAPFSNGGWSFEEVRQPMAPAGAMFDGFMC